MFSVHQCGFFVSKKSAKFVGLILCGQESFTSWVGVEDFECEIGGTFT
jgi:hypothetical protein